MAASAVGDLVARDTSGPLRLYQGNGAGNFTPRAATGSGWGGFSRSVGAGDVTNDGRPDLIAYGADGTYVHRATGPATAPFGKMSTNPYAGEGMKCASVG
ncbi:FG-GAP repeat domain-containing protein [Streptomyces sp. NPDC056528]|uniref:FG-GAP repeat domain-containing protein n=1 Tax=Streptomyces sp. NPDC056528 TaxID=3345854 RepID=UPI0036A4A0FD